MTANSVVEIRKFEIVVVPIAILEIIDIGANIFALIVRNNQYYADPLTLNYLNLTRILK